MLSMVVTFLVTAFLAYVGYVLFWGRSTETGTSINDCIADPPDDGEGPGVTPESVGDRYRTRYEEPGKQILILYGTESGFSEELAKKLFDRLQDNGCQELSLQPRVLNAKDFAMVEFDREQVLLCVFSTTGDGDPPREAKPFLDFLTSACDAPSSLGHVHYSVLALGDSNYPRYCNTGRSLEARLEVLGGRCLHSRVDIDQEDWPNNDGWIEGVVGSVGSVGGLELSTTMDYLDLFSQGEEDSGHSRT